MYPVLSSGVNRAVLEVSGQRVAIPQDLVEVRDKRPDRFTVVYRTYDDPNPARARERTRGAATVCVPSARPASRSAGGSFHRAPRVISASTRGSWRGGKRGDSRAPLSALVKVIATLQIL